MKTHKVFNKYVNNTFWIISEKIIALGLGFLLTIYMAKTLSVEDFGIYSYAFSLVTLLSVTGHAGLSGLLVREFVDLPNKKKLIFGTSFIIKFVGFFIGFILLLLINIYSNDINSTEFWVILILSFSLFFKPFDVINFFFQSSLKAKYPSISVILSACIYFVITILCLNLGYGLFAVSFTYLFQAIVLAFMLLIFLYFKHKIKIFDWKFSKKKAIQFLNEGGLVFLGSIFAMTYLKIDQIMIKNIIGSEEVAVYAISAKLSEAWYFVPGAIVTTFFPKIIKLRKRNKTDYLNDIQKMFDLLFLLALIIALLVTFFSDFLILNLFSEKYYDSIIILQVHIWAAIFVFLRSVFSKMILIENLLVFSVITHGLGAFFNIIFNYALIPIYGGIGASFATLFSYSISSYFSLLLSSKTRFIFRMMSKSLFLPIRIILKFK